MSLVVLLIYTSWTFTHMFSSKYLQDQPINNILFACEHGHNRPDSKWSLTHESWKGFSCRSKHDSIFCKTNKQKNRHQKKVDVTTSSPSLSHKYLSLYSLSKETSVSLLCSLFLLLWFFFFSVFPSTCLASVNNSLKYLDWFCYRQWTCLGLGQRP